MLAKKFTLGSPWSETQVFNTISSIHLRRVFEAGFAGKRYPNYGLMQPGKVAKVVVSKMPCKRVPAAGPLNMRLVSWCVAILSKLNYSLETTIANSCP